MLTKEAENFLTFLVISILIVFLGFTGLSSIYFDGYVTIDMLIVPVLIGSILTDKKYAILIGMTWGSTLMFSSHYMGYSLVSIAPTVLVSLSGKITFDYLSRKHKDMSMTAKLISSIFVAHMIHFLSIYNITSVTRVPLFYRPLSIKIALEFIGCIITKFTLKNVMRVEYKGGDVTDIRLRLGSCENKSHTGFIERLENVYFAKGSRQNKIIIEIDKETKDCVFIVTLKNGEKIDHKQVKGDFLENDFLIFREYEELVVYPIRRDLRIEVDKDVSYKLFNDDRFKNAPIINISRTGIQIQLKEKVSRINEDNNLQLRFKNDIPVDHTVIGKIKNIREVEGRYRLGIEFIKFQEKDKQTLINWVLNKSKKGGKIK